LHERPPLVGLRAYGSSSPSLAAASTVAVPGNHDGENLAVDSTLDGFIYNFCAGSPVPRPEAQDSPRTAMTQPYVYWTLLTPLVNIVGLYSNVPEGGEIRTPRAITGRYYEVPRPQEPYSKGSQLFDYCEYDWKKRAYIPNAP
jgi:hypothetical protein